MTNGCSVALDCPEKSLIFYATCLTQLSPPLFENRHEIEMFDDCQSSMLSCTDLSLFEEKQMSDCSHNEKLKKNYKKQTKVMCLYVYVIIIHKICIL